MFHCVQADPPWLERGGGKIKRGADRHYKLMKTVDILDLMLDTFEEVGVAEDAHLYLWVTNNFLEDGLFVMNGLGFRYITNVAWVKVKNDWPKIIDQLIGDDGLELNPITWAKVLADAVRIGIGQYFRGSHELCLFGVRGKFMRPKKALPTVFHAPRPKEAGKDKHSKKPERIYEICESTTKGPYLEMFARSLRPGWSSFGDELPED